MTSRTLTLLLAALLSMVAPGWSSEADYGRIYALPLTEAHQVILTWLDKNEFHVCQETRTYQTILYSAVKAQSHWRILLQSHSPLATRIHIEAAQKGPADEALVSAFWQNLESYVRESREPADDNKTSVPASVLARRNAVVCIYAPSAEGGDVQVTGFVVDVRGVIVCTGHDLDAGKSVRVQIADGKELNGLITKYNASRDLALVKVDRPLSAFVSLQARRDMLRPGERLFAVTCADGPTASVEAGYLEGPPRRVAGLVLWQARIHVAHGSSGSPVFDEEGRLVAVVKGRFRGTDTIGFLIPVETLMQFLDSEHHY